MKVTKEIEIPEPRPAPKHHKYIHRGWGWESDRILNYNYYNYETDQWLKSNTVALGYKNTYYLEIVRTHRDEDGTPVDIEPLPEMPNNVERVEYFGRGLTEEDMGDADNYIVYSVRHRKWLVNSDVRGGVTCIPPKGAIYCFCARVWYKKNKSKKKTLEETLRLLPDWLAERAISQIDKNYMFIDEWEDGETLELAIQIFADWWRTDEGDLFWIQAHEAIDGNEIDFSKLPDNPDAPKTTQLSDLIGEDGQKICYLHNADGSKYTFKYFDKDGMWGDGLFNNFQLTNEFRWSHSPFTKFEDANEFVFEEGGMDE